MSEPARYAPGQPGVPPTWTSSAKSGVGTALNSSSRVWFSIGQGILNEIYYPEVDCACTRDMEFLVSDGENLFSEEKKDTTSEISYLADGVPAFKITNTCKEGRFRISKEVITDPHRDVLLQQVSFIPLRGSLADYHLFVLLAPHLNNNGNDNTGFLDDYKGVPMLFAEREETALALTSSAPFHTRSVGFVGASDGWTDIKEHKLMKWSYMRAENGNVALTGEIDLQASHGHFQLALGFGRSPLQAANRARASLLAGFDIAKAGYLREWREWQESIPLMNGAGRSKEKLPLISLSVLRIHEAKGYPGGLISSLSIPWGFSRKTEHSGGYHLVWPRDMVEVGGALLAAGAKEEVHRVLHYLHSVQEPEGYWDQNMRLDGERFWQGLQMDETALPILLVDMARREEALDTDDLARLWPMVRKAAGFIARNGPITLQGRWEQDSGYSPFTLAAEIAALLAAADLADANHENSVAAYFRETADFRNANIERWTYLPDTKLARQMGVKGYYARIIPPDRENKNAQARGLSRGNLQDQPSNGSPVSHVIGPDILALVRFGLRMPDDPRIADTLKVVDALLKAELPQGPLWHRFERDSYGEYDDGSPFDGNGKGRCWPLLAGERAHYELAAGRRYEAERLLRTLELCVNEGGMIPEQIWDAPDIPEKGLFFGRPSGSAMPLVWAHAEYLKLLRSLRDSKVYDLPPQTVQRYLISRTDTPFSCWRRNQKTQTMSQGKILRVELLQEAIVHWSSDNWNTVVDTHTRNTGVGVFIADLPTAQLPPDTIIRFTFLKSHAQQWEGRDYEITILERAS